MGTRTVRVAQLVVVVALAGVGLLTPPAGAQEGEATITVDQAHPASGSTHYFVSVTTAEGEPVTDTEVTATPISPDGQEGDAVTLDTSGDGVYQGSVAMDAPGEWTVRFTSSNPAGTTEAIQEVEGATAPTESVPPDTTDTTDTTADDDDTEPDDATDADDTAAPADTEDDDDSSILPLVLLLAGLAAVAVLAVVLYFRGDRGDGPDADDGGVGTGDDTGGPDGPDGLDST